MREIRISLHKENIPFIFYVTLSPRWNTCDCSYCADKYVLNMWVNWSNSVYNIWVKHKNLKAFFPGMFAGHWDLWFFDETGNIVAILDKTKNDIKFSYINKDRINGTLSFIDKKKKKRIKIFTEKEPSQEVLFKTRSIILSVINENKERFDLIKKKEQFYNLCDDCLIADLLGKNDSEIAEEIKKEIENFINAETYFETLRKNVTVELLRNNCTQLKRLSAKRIKHYIDTFFEEQEQEEQFYDFYVTNDNREDNFEHSIRSITSNIIMDLEYEKMSEIHKKYPRETIETMYSDTINKIDDREYLLTELSRFLKNDKSKNESDFFEGINNFFSDFLYIERLYEDIKTSYGSTKVHFELTENKESRFLSYERGDILLNADEKKEYELLYCPAISHVNKMLYYEDERIIRNPFKNMPLFYKYFSDLMDWLFNNGVIYEDKGMIYLGDQEKLMLLPREMQLFSSVFGRICATKNKTN